VKKKKKKKEKYSETFWFSIFAMLFCAARCVVEHEW